MIDAVRVLQLFESILRQQPSDQRIRIVPVITDELLADEKVISAITERSGGIFIRAVDLADGTDGELDENLVRLVREARIERPGAAELVPAVTARNGRVRVELEGIDSTEGSDENPGFRHYRGALTALFSGLLRRFRLAVLAYDETEMDPSVARATRLLLCRQLEHQLLGDVRTLVVLIRASLDYEEHCSGVTCSARYHLEPQACRTRNELAFDRVRMGVAADIHPDPAVLFLGAGFSRSSGVPLAEKLRNDALRHLLRTDQKPELLSEEFRSYLRASERFLDGEDEMTAEEFESNLTLERVLREEFNHYDRDRSPTLNSLAEANASSVEHLGPAMREIKRVVDAGRRLVIVTVNQDTLVEVACGDSVRVFVTDSDFSESFLPYYETYLAGGGPVPLLKLHGTIDQRDTVVATVDLTLRGLRDSHRNALNRLTTERRPSWLYIGYSMRDLDLLGLMREAQFGARVDESWVAPFPEPNARRFAGLYRASIWRQRDAAEFSSRMITQTADVFMREFASFWCAKH